MLFFAAYADEDVVEGEDANNPVEEEEEEGVVEDEDDSNDVLAVSIKFYIHLRQ